MDEHDFDELCDEFEAAWSSEGRPEIETFLEKAPSEDRAALLYDLLQVELRLRRDESPSPSLDEYQERFSEYRDVVQESYTVFHTTTRSGQEQPTLPPSSETGNRPSDLGITLGAPTNGPSNAEDATIAPDQTRSKAAMLLSGERVRYFGDYEIIEEIARGGMGVVYKARQTSLNRVVALKMILAGQLAGEEEVQRFHAEAEAAANLDHPGIVPIYEIGQNQGQHYFSMGYVEGESLADKVKDGPLPPQEAAVYLQKVADAVAFAHSRKVIHRDLKPANVLIDADSQPKVTDFGLAKQVESDSDLTRTGAVMGTPSYMPPEQASGKTDEIAEPADVYSLGAILYCLITGRPPFQAANAIDTLMQVLEKEPVSPRRLNSAIPVDLENICLKCLAKHSHQRYSSADDLAADLRRYLNGEPVKARPLTRIARVYRWCRRNPWPATAGVALLMLALLTGFSAIGFRERLWRSLVDQARAERLARDRSRSLELVAEAAALKKNLELRREAIETITSPGVGQFCELQCDTGGLSTGFSTDGEQFAAVDLNADTLKIWSFPLGELLERRPIDQATYSIHEFTGRRQVWDQWRTLDGRRCRAMSTDLRLGLVREGSQVEIWDLKATERIAAVTNVAEKAQVRVSSDGRWLGVAKPDENNKIFIIETAGGEEVKTLTIRSRVGDAVFPNSGAFAFSADSTLLAAHGAEGALGIVRIWDLQSGEVIATIPGDFEPAWSKQGHFLATVGPSMDERRIGGFVTDERRSHRGTTFRTSSAQIVHHESGFVNIWRITPPTPAYWHSRVVERLSVAPNGKQLVVNGSVWTFEDNEHRKRESVTESVGHWVGFDNRSQAFAIDAWSDDFSATTSRPQTSKASALTFSKIGRSKHQPFVLREGSIKGLAPDNSTRRVVVDGQATEPRIDDVSVLHTVSVAFSRDGNLAASASIILSREHGVDGRTILNPSGTLLEVWDLVSRQRLRMWMSDGYNDRSSVAFSPDGSQVVTTAGDRLVLCDLPSDTRRPLTDEKMWGGNHVLFGSKGKRIYLVARGGPGTDVIRVLNAETGKEIATLAGHQGSVHCMAISPQGNTLASGGEDQMIRLWNCRTGEELARWKAHDDSVTALTFSLDGKSLVSGARDGSVKSWPIPRVRRELSELGLNWNDP